MAIRIFLDANILFSASFKTTSRFLNFWKVEDAIVTTSIYVASEAKRNCVHASHLDRLEHLLMATELIATAVDTMPDWVRLPIKDRPVLAGAIAGNADYLITGDKVHFSDYYDKRIETAHGSLTILPPALFLDRYF